MLAANSVGWVYDSAHNQTDVYVNNSTGPLDLNAATQEVKLNGHVALVSNDFKLV